MTAADSINLALVHTKQQLFKPFRIGQWTRLAFVGLLAGELGSNGCNRSNFQPHAHAGAVPHFGFPGSLAADAAVIAAFITVAVIAGLAIGVILMYVSSVMRFVLFDSIITRECHIRWSWSHRLGSGWRYFVWKLGYLLLTLAAVAALVGLPVAFAFAQGWLREPRQHLLVLVSGGFVLFMLLMVIAVITAVVLVLTKDFVIPQMALEDVDAMEGWRRLWQMMSAEKGAYTAYIVMKIVLALAAGILIGIATLILGIIFVLPTVGLGILAVITGKTAGLTWNPHTVALAAVIGGFLLAIFLYLVSLISVPVIVFFPAYSIYFFAARYPRLGAVLYPTSPPAPVPLSAAPSSP